MTNLEQLKILHGVQRKLLIVNQTLEIAELENPDMAVSAPIAELITQFDTATDKIAARIQRIIDGAAADGSFSADDKAALQAEVDKLNLLGQDQNNPVPPTV